MKRGNFLKGSSRVRTQGTLMTFKDLDYFGGHPIFLVLSRTPNRSEKISIRTGTRGDRTTHKDRLRQTNRSTTCETAHWTPVLSRNTIVRKSNVVGKTNSSGVFSLGKKSILLFEEQHQILEKRGDPSPALSMLRVSSRTEKVGGLCILV